MNGFENIASSMNTLGIYSNPLLNNIDALANIESIYGYKIILDNDLLSDYSIESVCFHLKNNGNSVINKNSNKCNDVTEVLGYCANLLTNNEEFAEFNIYPNPTEGIINNNSQFSQNYVIIVLDIFGRVIIEETTKNKKLDLSNLINGVYFVSIHNGFKSYSLEIVKK